MYVRTKEIRVSKFDLSGNQRSVRGRKYISVNWIMRAILPSSRYLIQHRYYIHIYVVIEIFELVTKKAHTIFDWPTLSPFRRFVFWREKGIQEAGGLGKSDTNKKEGGGKKWKVEKRGGGNDCFTMTDTCSRARLITTSLNSYAFYEFPAFFCPDIRTRVFNPHAWITRTCANGTKTNRLAIDESNALH